MSGSRVDGDLAGPLRMCSVRAHNAQFRGFVTASSKIWQEVISKTVSSNVALPDRLADSIQIQLSQFLSKKSANLRPNRRGPPRLGSGSATRGGQFCWCLEGDRVVG